MQNELFWKLLKPVHPMAASFCRKLTGDLDEGDDLYQEALLMALRKQDGLKDPAAFRPWLFRIIVNTFKNRRRGFWHRRRANLTREAFEATPGDDPRDRLDSRRLLQRLLSVLSAEDRAMVILHELEGWPLEDLVRMFRKPEGTIKTRLFRAKGNMRRYLERRLPTKRSNLISEEAGYALQTSETTDT